MKLAEDCLQKSKDKLLSSSYFYELSENLETLLADVSATLFSGFTELLGFINFFVSISLPGKANKMFWTSLD